MSDQGGGDRPRWEGFPGGVDPDDYATGPVEGYVPPAAPGEPVPPQFPVQQPVDETAPIPVVGSDAPGDGDGSALGPRRSRNAHAAPRRETSRYVAIACAVAVVLVGAGFGFVACNNNDASTTAGSNTPVVPAASPSLVPSTVQPVPSNSPLPTTTPTPTTSSSASKSATTSPSASASSSTSSSPSPSATATAAATKQPVVVLNSTAITGLAKRVAANIESGGWTVTKTTNWTGAKPSVSTIYYLPGAKNKASAQLFAKKFDVAKAVKPALPGMTSNLTLVLTRDAS